MNNVPGVMNPYQHAALLYRAAGFGGPLPLPYKMKEPVPVDYNKRVSKYPTVDKIKEWAARPKQQNICVRMAGVDAEHEMIGIDVDDYYKGDKKKEGASQLLALEARLGPLPNTWISSARIDGKSGIRYYRVPRGLAFRGKVDKDIEVIRKGHRYSVVWPSVHPDGGTYWWFAPGTAPGKDERDLWDGKLPDARLFPELPEAWVEFLTNGRTLAVDDELIDVDSSYDDVVDWAVETFHGNDPSEPMCPGMRKKLDTHLEKLKDTATYHDLLTNAHWNLIFYAFEGHHGFGLALAEYEQALVDRIIDTRGGTTDRTMQTLHNEIFRSRAQALRKVKGKSDERVSIGAEPVDPSCYRTGVCGVAGDAPVGAGVSAALAGGGGEPPGEFDDVPKGPTGPLEDFEMSDDGNALHFYKYFSTVEGPSFHWVEGYGWIIWHNGDGEKPPRWERDETGKGQIRRMWQEIKKQQQNFADQLELQYYTDLATAIQQNNVTASGNPLPGSALAGMKQQMMKRKEWAERSGNNRQAENALEATCSLSNVSISVNSMDRQRFLLGVANGVVELTDQVMLRKALPSDLITMNTNVPWEKPSNHASTLWKNYLDTFLPDIELQKVVQIILGYCLIGGNPQKKMIILKGGTNTGKSTLISAIESALGDYAQAVNETAFQSSKFNEVLATSLEKRVITCSEFERDTELSAAMIKRVTGNDVITQSIKFSNAVKSGEPQFVPILATNAVPSISGPDQALKQRLIVIPFNVVAPVGDESKHEVIKNVCGTAVLDWLIEGYQEYRQSNQLPVSNLITRETEKFFGELDEITTFAEDCIVSATSPQQYISRRDMYQKFETWWIENQYPLRDKPSMPKFTRALKAQGFKTRDTRFRVESEMNHWWIGVKFKKSITNVISLSKVSQKLTETNPETETETNRQENTL